MVQAKKVRTAKDYKLPGWISNVLRGEDLLLSVLVVELDNVFLHNLYLWKTRLSGNLEVAHFQKEDQ